MYSAQNRGTKTSKFCCLYCFQFQFFFFLLLNLSPRKKNLSTIFTTICCNTQNCIRQLKKNKMENACTPLMKLPPCSQPECSLQPRASTRTVQKHKVGENGMQCSAFSPPRLEQLMLARANMYRVNGFFCADRHDGSRGTVEEIQSFRREWTPGKFALLQTSAKGDKIGLEKCAWAARRGSIGADSPRAVRPRVWLPSPWQRRADCLAFRVTPLIKRCAVITACGEKRWEWDGGGGEGECIFEMITFFGKI